MITPTKQANWGVRWVSWWLTLVLAAGIIYIGLRFMISPETGAEGFGLPFVHADDVVYGRVKGIRDVISGLVAVPLLWMRLRKATAWVLTILILVPAADFLIVLAANGWQDGSHLAIHGATVLVMAITIILLFRGR